MPALAPRRRSARAPLWVHVGEVESFTDSTERYEIKRRIADGHLGCSCLGYRFAKGVKTCKHLDAWTGQGRVISVEPIARRPVATTHADTETRIDVRGETFTVRRAISFGGL